MVGAPVYLKLQILENSTRSEDKPIIAMKRILNGFNEELDDRFNDINIFNFGLSRRPCFLRMIIYRTVRFLNLCWSMNRQFHYTSRTVQPENPSGL